MKNIHLLPTDKPSRFTFRKDCKYYRFRKDEFVNNDTYQNQNIYITSPNEDINDNDYIITKDGRLVQVSYLLSKDLEGASKIILIQVSYLLSKDLEGASKIILTTDQDLIKDGVQAIDDEFLDWFVKNPSCEKAEVNYDKDVFPYGVKTSKGYGWYKIIIPKEESKQDFNPTQGEEVWIKVFSNWSKGTYIGYDITKKTHLVREDEEGGGHLLSSSEILPYYSMPNEPKQETLEEAAERVSKTNSVYETAQDDFYQGFIEGAKWMEERMYSEEEAYKIWKAGQEYWKTSGESITFEELVEQNKKK